MCENARRIESTTDSEHDPPPAHGPAPEPSTPPTPTPAAAGSGSSHSKPVTAHTLCRNRRLPLCTAPLHLSLQTLNPLGSFLPPSPASPPSPPAASRRASCSTCHALRASTSFCRTASVSGEGTGSNAKGLSGPDERSAGAVEGRSRSSAMRRRPRRACGRARRRVSGGARGRGRARGGRTPSIERGSFETPNDSMRLARGQKPNSDVTRENVLTSVLRARARRQRSGRLEEEEEERRRGRGDARERVVGLLTKDLPLEHLHELCAVDVPAPRPELPPRPSRAAALLELSVRALEADVDLGLFEDPGRVDALDDLRGPARDLAALEDEARRAQRVGRRVEGARDDVGREDVLAVGGRVPLVVGEDDVGEGDAAGREEESQLPRRATARERGRGARRRQSALLRRGGEARTERCRSCRESGPLRGAARLAVTSGAGKWRAGDEKVRRGGAARGRLGAGARGL